MKARNGEGRGEMRERERERSMISHRETEIQEG